MGKEEGEYVPEMRSELQLRTQPPTRLQAAAARVRMRGPHSHKAAQLSLGTEYENATRPLSLRLRLFLVDCVFRNFNVHACDSGRRV